jgi:Metallo-beta-lactamase superfamily
MKKRALLLFSATAMIALPAMAWAQGTRYPVTIIPPGKGPYTFPDGYQTPWDKIDIMVTEKISPNLFILHGSQGLDLAHPDASGGRAMVLFGTDGVLLVDTENRQVAEKTLKAIRSFTDAPIKVMVNSHIHSDHTGANAFFARQGALIFAQENLRDEMLRPPLLASGQLAPAPDLAGVPVATTPAGPMDTVRSYGLISISLPRNSGGSAPASPFSRPAQRSLRYGLHARRVAIATLYTGGSGGFVTSAAAPIATGWSEQLPGEIFTRCGPTPFHGALN